MAPTRSQSAPRRSGRERKQVASVYTEAAAAKLVQDESPRNGRKRGSKRAPKDDESDEETEDDDEEEAASEEERSEEESEEESESDDDDDDFEAGKPAKTTAKGGKTKGGPTPRKAKTQIRTGRSPAAAKGKGTKKGKGGATSQGAGAAGSGGKKAPTKAAQRKAAHQALAALARAVLPAGEVPGLSSLVAGLLHAHRPSKKEVELGDLPEASEYTPNLCALAREVVRVHGDQPNRAEVALLNLLFRSVGGGQSTDLPLGLGSNKKGGDSMDTDDDEEERSEGGDEEEEAILDDMDTEEWARVVTDLVDDMRHVPANRILLCADPLGAVHQAEELTRREKRAKNGAAAGARDGKGSAGSMEYRKIYAEFWYALAHVALTEGGMATTKNEFTQPAGGSDDDDSEGEEGGPAIVRLDAELVKGLLLRIVELSPVGQPDVRAAATLAALSMSHAVLDQSAVLAKKLDVAHRQYAAATKGRKSPGRKSPGGAKAESLKLRTESLKRTIEDLEEVVLGPVVQGLFVHRYRDSNEHIRALCLASLSRYTLQRPDLFLTDKYLKYLGWMMHDKSPYVREAAFRGLLAPFEAVSDAAAGAARKPGDEHLMIEKIELGALEHVVAKFLGRICGAVEDPDAGVQGAAVRLMLQLLRGGFLDDVQDDGLWDKTNLRCLAPDASDDVRRTALYFVLDQLEAFDDGGEDERAAPDERKRAGQLDAIASYAAHALTAGSVPLDKIKVDAADYLVRSLRGMPEHRGLATDWGALLRALKEDRQSATATNVAAGERADVAKQRVLVRMLACAAREEAGSVADEAFLVRGADAEAVETVGSGYPAVGGKKKGRAGPGREHETLSVALLKALPGLLGQFKGDLSVVPELAGLPRFLIPTVFSLPQRKADYLALLKNLGEIYLSSSDDRVLDSAARSLAALCRGDHARTAESKAQLRKVVIELRDRVVELMSPDDATVATSAVSLAPESDVASVRSKRGRSARKAKTPMSALTSPAESDRTSLTGGTGGTAPDADAEYSAYLNLKRLKVLAKKCDLREFFDGRGGVNELELLCNFVADGMKSRLRACKPVDLRIHADEETTVHKLIDHPEVLGAIGKGVAEGLEFLLCVIAWFVDSTQHEEDLIVEDETELIDEAAEGDDDDDEVTDHPVLRLRSRLLAALELCFAQYIPSREEHADDETSVAQHSEEQRSFSDYVQLAAGKTTADLRVLFPKEYADAASPTLRAFALREDGRLIGAYVRFLNSKEHLLRENEAASAHLVTPSKAERYLSQSLLYPMGRAVAGNWVLGNRREAGVFLRHASASGPAATEIVAAASRAMRKIDPVRMLESQMASLRQSYEGWVDDTPELDADRPSEAEMGEFEEAERAHAEDFVRLEQRASQFSGTLGAFGRLSDKKIGPALHGFVKEGIRFGFSNIDENGEETLVLGSRLSFLSLLSKYASWAKKATKEDKAKIQAFVDELETDMRRHEEFDEVHADDLECLAMFRKNLSLKALSVKSSSSRSGASVASAFSHKDDDESLDSVGQLPSPSPSQRSGGSKSTRNSRLSTTLPTLPEGEKESPEDGSDSDASTKFSESPSPKKGKRTYDEGSDSDESSRIGMEGPSSKRTSKRTRRGR
ncbi:hypothetical protein ACHAXT_004938 [Thalassiosira profunda]